MKRSQCPSRKSSFIPLIPGNHKEVETALTCEDCANPKIADVEESGVHLQHKYDKEMEKHLPANAAGDDPECVEKLAASPSSNKDAAGGRKPMSLIIKTNNLHLPSNAVKKPILCLATTTEASQAKASSDHADPVYYEVYWTKFTRKKQKVFEDGILILKENRAELQRDTGEVVCKTNTRVKASAELIGTIINVGSNECEFVKQITEDEYITKGLDRAADRAKTKSTSAKSLHSKSKPFGGHVTSALQNEHPVGMKERQKYSVDPSRQGAFVVNESHDATVVIDPVVGTFLKPHQVEGVRFLCGALHRQSAAPSAHDITGCILADEMGLGKTLQTITLIWTLLKQSIQNAFQPTIRKALIVCPSSLVFNWRNEFKKWLGDQRLPVQTVTQALIVKKQGGAAAQGAVNDFVLGNVKKVCIISYDMVRRHIDALKACADLQLLVCDEGHRLKNIDGNATIDALNNLPCRKRILLSGTPVQNDLDEFYAMVNFVSPGLLGDARSFRLLYSDSIIKSRDKSSSEDQQRIGRKRLEILNKRTSPIILRRTSEHIAAQLPPKVENIIFCAPSSLQVHLCRQMMSNADYRKVFEGGSGQIVLSLIAKISKVLNHPDLLLMNANEEDESAADVTKKRTLQDQTDWSQFFPPDYQQGDAAHSGKLAFLFGLLSELHGQDRIVIVSNYTSTLELLQAMCKALNYPTVRLDGSTDVQKRADIVSSFNSPQSEQFIFLLSSKAGGCGLNLVGANRIVLLDASWNPAHDAQAMARVWRFGQTKKVFIYRLLTTGTMEEKIFQKQIKKGEFEQLVVDHREDVSRNFEGNIRDIFILRSDTVSDTYDVMWKKERCGKGAQGDDVICIAGYKGSTDIQLVADSSGDKEFSATVALRSGGVTFLLQKTLDCRSAEEGMLPSSSVVSAPEDPASPAQPSLSDFAAQRDGSDSEGEELDISRGQQKRRRVRSFQEEESDG